MKYYIPKNTPIWRRVLGVSWSPIMTEKPVTYDDTDLLPDLCSRYGEKVWVFKLPQHADPYIEICVEKQDVAVF